MEPKLSECQSCKRLGTCCSFTYRWPETSLVIETDHVCPFLSSEGLCSVYPLRHIVPWCDFDAEGNRGTEIAADYPSWCPHASIPPSQTFEEVFRHAPFSKWSDDQKEAFQKFVNAQAYNGIVRAYPGWEHVLDSEGEVSNVTEGWTPASGYINPAHFGPCVPRAQRRSDRSPESDEA